MGIRDAFDAVVDFASEKIENFREKLEERADIVQEFALDPESLLDPENSAFLKSKDMILRILKQNGKAMYVLAETEYANDPDCLIAATRTNPEFLEYVSTSELFKKGKWLKVVKNMASRARQITKDMRDSGCSKVEITLKVKEYLKDSKSKLSARFKDFELLARDKIEKLKLKLQQKSAERKQKQAEKFAKKYNVTSEFALKVKLKEKGLGASFKQFLANGVAKLKSGEMNIQPDEIEGVEA